jgi:outer membrane protein assembly factor BamB
VVGDLVIVPLGGLEKSSVSLIAFRALTGEEVWRGGNAQISYASPQLVEFRDNKQVVSVNEDNVSGHELNTGRKLWEYPWPGKSNGGANCSQPLPYQSDMLLLGKGYGGGGTLIRIVEANGAFAAEEQWHRNKLLKTKFTNTVIVGDYGYALSDGTLECVNLREGTFVWKQSRSQRFGHGQILGIEDVLLVLSESGELAMVALDPSGYRELARMPLLNGTTWNTLAVSGRKLLIRNSQEAACVELPKLKSTPGGEHSE